MGIIVALYCSPSVAVGSTENPSPVWKPMPLDKLAIPVAALPPIAQPGTKKESASRNASASRLKKDNLFGNPCTRPPSLLLAEEVIPLIQPRTVRKRGCRRLASKSVKRSRETVHSLSKTTPEMNSIALESREVALSTSQRDGSRGMEKVVGGYAEPGNARVAGT